jgi:hypothetical protein
MDVYGSHALAFILALRDAEFDGKLISLSLMLVSGVWNGDGLARCSEVGFFGS